MRSEDDQEVESILQLLHSTLLLTGVLRVFLVCSAAAGHSS